MWGQGEESACSEFFFLYTKTKRWFFFKKFRDSEGWHFTVTDALNKTPCSTKLTAARNAPAIKKAHATDPLKRLAKVLLSAAENMCTKELKHRQCLQAIILFQWDFCCIASWYTKVRCTNIWHISTSKYLLVLYWHWTVKLGCLPLVELHTSEGSFLLYCIL